MNARLIQIIRMLAGGPKDPREIADRLGLSPITARRHIQRLRDKGYWIELDASGRYFVIGKETTGKGEMRSMQYGERVKGIEEEMEKAAYKYILEGTVAGMMATRNERGEMVWKFTPADVADHLGVDIEVADRILLRLEEARYLTRYGQPRGGLGAVYHPCEAGIFNAFRHGLVKYDEREFSRLISKQRFTLPDGFGLSIIASKEEELPDGGTRFETYSHAGLQTIKDLTEGFIGLALDAQSSDRERSMPEIPDPDTENEIQPESNMLSRFLTEFNPIKPWPWLWLMDLKEDMHEEEWKEARSLYWSRAMRFLLILLRPIYRPLLELGVEGCAKMTEEKMTEPPERSNKSQGGATDAQILKKSLEAMEPRRFWELSRALCLELLRSCLNVCQSLGITDDGTQEATPIVGKLEKQQRSSR